MGYEFEMHGIPDSFKNEINDNIWQFIDQVNLIHRNVCCWDRNAGGMGKINIENFIRSKHMKIYDNIIDSEYFLWHCSDISYMDTA